MREVLNYSSDEDEFINVPMKSKEECGCSCSDEESCDLCENQLDDVCSIEDTYNHCRNASPFQGVANLLTTVKKYEFVSLVEGAYAQIGNKPFKLKATQEAKFTDEQMAEPASAFYEFLENFLEVNQVRVNEITTAFNLETLGDVTAALASNAQNDAEIRLTRSLTRAEGVLERVFKRAAYMNNYIEVIKDTTDYPIGVMWVDDKAVKKERTIDASGNMSFNYQIQCDANRIDPCYFWATEDHRLNNPGRAVFKLEQFTSGDLRRWKEHDVAGSKQLSENIDEYLEDFTEGHRSIEAMLFNDHYDLDKGMYDILIGRGRFDIEGVKELGVNIPKEYENENYIPCEVYFSGTTILRVRVLKFMDDNLGVYTTVFRRKGQGIFGYSLHEFLYPFAKLYEGTIEAIDLSVGKSTGSLLQIDTGVIEDPDKYLTKDKDGNVAMDLAGDTIIEFDSSNAYSSPNFKGVPITIDQLPSNLNDLLPVVDFIFAQLERISGIPSILVNGSNVSSALRTNSNFNAAFSASAKVIQSLLRESEKRILEPSIRAFFDFKAMSGDMKDFLVEAEPEILLSDTLAREINDDQQLLQGVQTLAQFSSLIPPEKLSALINQVGRKVYDLDEDLIPGTSPLNTSTPPTPVQSV